MIINLLFGEEMAINRNGANGTFKGKVGSVIGYEWRGIPVIRGLPKKRTKKPSDKELSNRERMRITQVFLQKIKGFIRLGFAEDAKIKNISAFNAAISYNKKHAIVGEYPELTLNYSAVLVAKGNLLPPQNPSVKLIDDKLVFSWKRIMNDKRQRVMLLVFDEHMTYGNMILGGAYHSEEQEVISIDGEELPSGTVLHSYIAFISDMHDAISDSVYCGLLKV